MSAILATQFWAKLQVMAFTLYFPTFDKREIPAMPEKP
jgi:hypothetical protein